MQQQQQQQQQQSYFEEDDEDLEIHYCAVCNSTDVQICTGCLGIFYCGSEHQLQHWPVHKVQCLNTSSSTSSSSTTTTTPTTITTSTSTSNNNNKNDTLANYHVSARSNCSFRRQQHHDVTQQTGTPATCPTIFTNTGPGSESASTTDTINTDPSINTNIIYNGCPDYDVKAKPNTVILEVDYNDE
ncbi:hypothetical protein SAMD00019534_023790 [Acytostelium subglobosum LB1]|uniref:hypothetical protein n=1 Tax=Acytostelium subglobosum LB1 TaxID=1410327 RepID=UPI000644A302|nr:hypothetical protein SAMD00019534_023790 [Acytostelium subglobosum LB1]GAM19204.1 hypothetical protein SAMD00019534_023790 [Acytostelium subglobosum LB1]|eukprot:XP_012757131.1 hypothetical protein SAMD00019534_023790 [Acytostelium subglobosum LB1]